MRVSDFDYSLPPGLIAQAPIEPRDAARMLLLRRYRPATPDVLGTESQPPGVPRPESQLPELPRRESQPTDLMEHLHVRDLPDVLRPGDLLVANRSRVLPARILG